MHIDHRPAAHPAPLLGHDPDHLGDWRLLGRLGAGGTGTVYLARSDAGRTVALKRAHPELAAQAGFRARFRAGVSALGTLTHACGPGARHFAALVDADPDGERPWLATEYLCALSLPDAVRRHGPWPAPAVAALGAALADALATVHRAGLVHRDVKPSQVLVTAAGPRVIDCGIDRGVDARGAASSPSSDPALDSHAFAAPERSARRDPHPAADVFALGGVLAFAATGLGPFGAGGAEEPRARGARGGPDLTALDDPDGVLRRAVERAVAAAPSDRPTAAELHRLLSGGATAFCSLLPAPVLAEIAARTTLLWDPPPPRRVQDLSSPSTALPPAPPAADQPAGRRPTHRRTLVLGALGTLATAATVGSAAYLTGRALRPDPDPPRPSARASPTARAARGDGGAPRPVWEFRGRIGHLTRPLTVGGVLALVSDTTGEMIGVDIGRGRPRWAAQGVHSDDPAASGVTRQGRVIVTRARYAARDDRLALIHPADGRTWYTEPLGVDFAALSGSPIVAADGPLLYVVGHGAAPPGTVLAYRPRQLLAYHVDRAETLWRRPISRDTVNRVPGVLRDGRLLLREPGAVRAYRASDGALLWQRAVPGATAWLAPAGDAVLVTGQRMALFEVATGRTVAAVDTPPPGTDRATRADDPPFGPAVVDAGTAYVPVRGGGLIAWDLDTRRRRWSRGPQGTTRPPRLAPTVSRGLVFPPVADGRTVLHALDAHSGRTAWRLREDEASTGPTHVLAEGARLYVTRGAHVRALPLT